MQQALSRFAARGDGRTYRWQRARTLELRAATGLARLWHTHGRSSDARDLLTPIHETFTEGHDTPDLKEAGRVLATMA